MLSEDDEGGHIEDWAVVASGDGDGVFIAGEVDGWGNDELSEIGGEAVSAVLDVDFSAVEFNGDASFAKGLAFATAGGLGGHDHLVSAGFWSFDFPANGSVLVIDGIHLAVAVELGAFGGAFGNGPIGDGDLDANFVSGRIGEWDVVLAIGVGGWGSVGPGVGDDLGVVWASGLGGRSLG